MRKALAIPMVALLIAVIGTVAYATTNVSTATFTADIVPQNTNAFAVQGYFPFPLSRPAMIQSDILNSTGRNLALCTAMDCDGANVEVPFMGGPATSTLEYYRHFDQSGGFTNDTTDAQDAGANDVLVMDGDPENGDAVYYGFDTQQRIIQPNIGVPGAGEWELAWSYSSVTSTTSTWAALSGVTDDTNAYRNGGVNEVSWDLPLDWVSSTVNGQTAFWVRSVFTDTTSVITAALGTQVFQEQGFFTAIATTTAQSFAKNTEKTLFMYAGGDTNFVNEYPVITSRIASDTGIPNSNVGGVAGDIQIEWQGYYGNSPIDDILKTVTTTNMVIDWTCTGAACGITASMDNTGDDCDLNAESAAWTNKVIKIAILEAGSLCTLEIDDVSQDTDVTSGGQSFEDGQAWELNFDHFAYLEYFSSTAISGVNQELRVLWQLDATALSAANYVSATPQLQNQGVCAGCNAELGFVFQDGFSGRSESFEPVFTPDTVEQVGSLDIVPILPTTTFATLTTPNQSLPGGDAIHHALSNFGVGLPTTWFWGAFMLGITALFIIGAGILSRGNFLAVLIAGGIPVWIATAPQVTIFPIWVAAVYTAIAIISFVIIKGNVLKI